MSTLFFYYYTKNQTIIITLTCTESTFILQIEYFKQNGGCTMRGPKYK